MNSSAAAVCVMRGRLSSTSAERSNQNDTQRGAMRIECSRESRIEANRTLVVTDFESEKKLTRISNLP